MEYNSILFFLKKTLTDFDGNWPIKIEYSINTIHFTNFNMLNSSKKFVSIQILSVQSNKQD